MRKLDEDLDFHYEDDDEPDSESQDDDEENSDSDDADMDTSLADSANRHSFFDLGNETIGLFPIWLITPDQENCPRTGVKTPLRPRNS